MNRKTAGNIDFEEFVRQHQGPPEGSEPIDRRNERDEWLRHLKELYDRIEAFLASYIKRGEIRPDYRDIELNEEGIGSYIARQMILRIGGLDITLTPIGTLLFGSKGRVDIEGPMGRARLVLVNNQAERPGDSVTVSIGTKSQSQVVGARRGGIQWVWKIATGPPLIRFIDLTPESLFQALMEVANG